MTGKQPYRPWGELSWALSLSQPKRWSFFGCVGPEERSVKALIELQKMDALADIEMLRIHDTWPEDPATEGARITDLLKLCHDAGCPIQPTEVALDAPLLNSTWRERLSFNEGTSLCLDISSMPKRFFFQVIKAALESSQVRNFLVIYSKPESYPDRPLSGNPEQWSTMTGFGCDDPDVEKDASARLIVGAGFVVDGLIEHLKGRGTDGIQVNILIPFPAEPWKSVRRSWESAREIEESLGADPDEGKSEVKPSCHRIGALDTSTAFETLLRLTKEGTSPAALAPLGPKPISVAMCLLASQSPCYPIHYAQPTTYAVDYSLGCEKIYAYWIKHEGENLYAL